MTAPPTVRVHAAEPWWTSLSTPTQQIPIRADARFIGALERSSITLAVASRQDSVLFLISACKGACTASVVRLAGPMGIAVRGDSLAIGTALSIRVYHDLTAADPTNATFLPVATHVTGAASIHEVAWDASSTLWFVNTAFSALCNTDGKSHFHIGWRPDFIAEDGPFDCCHLNGMALDAEGPRYATALAATGTREGWRAYGPDRGVLLDIDRGTVLTELSMPHSAVMHDDALWFLESGRGRLIRYRGGNTSSEIVCEVPGVLRGLDFTTTDAFIGLSKVRPTSGDVTDILQQRFPQYAHCRVFAFDLSQGELSGYAELPRITEISSVRVLRKPSVQFLQPDNAQTATTFVYTS
jgi:uncharacterized protein (TIGR03032 family)